MSRHLSLFMLGGFFLLFIASASAAWAAIPGAGAGGTLPITANGGLGGSGIVTVITSRSTTLSDAFRDASILYLPIYGIVLGMSWATGQVQENSLINFIFGCIFVVGAQLLVTLYAVIYSF